MIQARFSVNTLKINKMFDIAKLIEKEPELFDDLCNDYPNDDKNILICVEMKEE